ncbi:hypothetical protein DFJ74DRAFT_774022 [Hyaloraphidium curvatum]|nr:hypothetical protein DFJ74DRAFT_774022 [Hyaloraphidium curvatum]
MPAASTLPPLLPADANVKAASGLPSPPAEWAWPGECAHGAGEGACFACFASRPLPRGSDGEDGPAQPVAVPPGRWSGAPPPASPASSVALPSPGLPSSPGLLQLLTRSPSPAPAPSPGRRPSLPPPGKPALRTAAPGKPKRAVSFGGVREGTTWSGDEYARGIDSGVRTLGSGAREAENMGEGGDAGVPRTGARALR